MYVCLNRGTAGANLPLEAFVKLAADAGFTGADVDLGYGAEKGSSSLRDLYARHNLRFGGWGAPDWRSDPDKARQGVENLPKLARIARELDIDSCCTWIMPSSDLDFIQNWNFHVQRIKPVAQVLADHGLRFGLEFVAPYHLRRKFKHEFISAPGLMLELADAIGPNVGLLVDCFHCHASGTSWEHLSQIPAEKIVLCHLNDCPAVPLDQIQDGNRLLPGDGSIDLPAFFGSLRKAGYEGPISLEVFNAELNALPPQQAATRAWEATSRSLRSGGIQ
jgi:sugar phosphate isomerase/epimerase